MDQDSSRTVDQRAMDIAQKIDRTWHLQYGHGNYEVPISTIAAVALLDPAGTGDSQDQAAGLLLGLESEEFVSWIQLMWRTFVRARPDLTLRAWPLIAPWLSDDPISEPAVRAAKAVADTAARAGQLHLTGNRSRRDVDLLGVVLTTIRSDSGKAALGQFYTPSPVAEAMAATTIEPNPGQSIYDPAAGTGGLLRAAAAAIRDKGGDPATMAWFANDIDPLAIACLAVNAVLWELGPAVILGVADTLTDPDWADREIQERQRILNIARDARALAELARLERQ